MSRLLGHLTKQKRQKKPKLDTQLPACTGCGVLVSSECRALQCDKCVENGNVLIA